MGRELLGREGCPVAMWTLASGQARFLAFVAAGLSAFLVSALAARLPLIGSNISF